MELETEQYNLMFKMGTQQQLSEHYLEHKFMNKVACCFSWKMTVLACRGAPGLRGTLARLPNCSKWQFPEGPEVPLGRAYTAVWGGAESWHQVLYYLTAREPWTRVTFNHNSIIEFKRKAGLAREEAGSKELRLVPVSQPVGIFDSRVFEAS